MFANDIRPAVAFSISTTVVVKMQYCMIYFCKVQKSHKMTDVASNLHNIVLKIKRNMPNIIDTGQNLTKLLQN